MVWFVYSALFFFLTPAIIAAIGKGKRGASFSFGGLFLASIVFGLIVTGLQKIGLVPRESFQLRGRVGSARTASRKEDAEKNPIRTCATDFDCIDNATRKRCEAAMCK
jgi:hypothetical protein